MNKRNSNGRFANGKNAATGRQSGVKSILRSGSRDAAETLVQAAREGDVQAAQQPHTHSNDEHYARQYKASDAGEPLLLSKNNSYIEGDTFVVVDSDRCPIGAVYSKRGGYPLMKHQANILRGVSTSFSIYVNMAERGINVLRFKESDLPKLRGMFTDSKPQQIDIPFLEWRLDWEAKRRPHLGADFHLVPWSDYESYYMLIAAAVGPTIKPSQDPATHLSFYESMNCDADCANCNPLSLPPQGKEFQKKISCRGHSRKQLKLHRLARKAARDLQVELSKQ